MRAQTTVAAALVAALMLTAVPGESRAEAGQGERIPAPELKAKVWINSPPLTLKQLRGKVVLVDFWEYTCINCIRTFPYLRRWQKLYAPLGLVIIGVHTPEFAFAKNPRNVAAAVKRFGFTFPVAVDSDYKIWDAFHNDAWPADYLIDKNGNVAFVHVGEGNYGEMERRIQALLKEANPKLDFAAAKFTIPEDKPMFGGACRRATAETYLGYARAANIANPGGEDRTREVHYIAPADLPIDNFALNGNWLATAQAVRHVSKANKPGDSLSLHYRAMSVYMVAGSDNGVPKRLYLTQDGSPLSANARGVDVKADAEGRAYIELSGKRMYYLVSNPEFGTHTLTLYATAPSLSLYSFTFGNNCENKFAHR